MIGIVCVDDKGGMAFNRRRVTKDRVVVDNIIKTAAGKKLWMSDYSKQMFQEQKSFPKSKIEISIDEKFDQAKEEDFVFFDKMAPTKKQEESMTELVIYYWNRVYPSDEKYQIKKEEWNLLDREEWAGYSHDKITKERYKRKKDELD